MTSTLFPGEPLASTLVVYKGFPAVYLGGNTLQFECRSKSRAGLVHHQEFDADKLVMRCDCEWGSSPDAYPRFKEHSLDLLVADQCQPCWHLRSLHRHVLPYLRSLDIL